MKYYVFLTANIHVVGGMQNYVEGKAEFLKEQGWNISVFFCGSNTGKCVIPALDEYVSGGMEELVCCPGEWTKRIQQKVINRMILYIGCENDEEKEIIVESQNDVTALWGEMLAEKLEAKHVCFICNELFTGEGKYYKEHLDFFDFKHVRKELTGIHEKSLGNLFGDYKKILPEERYHFCAATKEPIQEVENAFLERFVKGDWTICYIGRAEKNYVEGIIKGVFKLALKYTEKQIQFIMVGNADSRKELLNEMFGNLNNAKLFLLGDMVPIPKALFKKVDVVVAGAGCANYAAYEKTPTIVADAGNNKANGILGYTTWDTLFHDSVQQLDFEEALEQVLVDRIQDRLKFKMPQKYGCDYYYRQHMEFVENSSKEFEYYKEINRNTSKNYKKVVKYNLRHRFPLLAEIYKKMRS